MAWEISRINKIRALSDSTSVRTSRARRFSEEIYVTIHHDQYDTSGFVRFVITPEGIKSLVLPGISVSLGNLHVGTVLPRHMWNDQEDLQHHEPNPDFQRTSSLLVSWLEDMLTQNKRSRLQFTAIV